MKITPLTLSEFTRLPTAAEWQSEIDDGWPGPDGSSSSTDTIMGVRIGITSASVEDVDLPANHHDWMYRLGRKFQLDAPWRLAADLCYRNECLQRVKAAFVWYNPIRAIGVARCWARYAGLRVGAKFAWTAKALTRKEVWGPEAPL